MRAGEGSTEGYLFDVVPCGRCAECLARRANGWAFRLLQESLVSESCAFVTFTYEDEALPYSEQGLPTLRKDHWQNFMKRLRNEVDPGTLKYYAAGEYGTETHRPHYHAILFNLPPKSDQLVSDKWGKGNIHYGDATGGAFAYTAKYINKRIQEKPIVDETTGEILEDDRVKEFSLMSKGMGANFLTDQMIKHLRQHKKTWVMFHGHPVNLPRYYTEKIFSKEERKQMRLEYEKDNVELFKRAFNDDYYKYNDYIRTKVKMAEKAEFNKRNKI